MIEPMKTNIKVGKISYEGLESKNLLSFRWYNPEKAIAGTTMKEWLRFACAYWHSFNGNGGDPFGEATHIFPWMEIEDPLERAHAKADAAFDFMTNLGIEYYCFHDTDVVDFTNDVRE